MLTLVPTTQTKVTVDQIAASFVNGWIDIYNDYPKKEQIAVLYAQNALETGGTKYMFCYNLGNVKAVDVSGQTIEYCMLSNVWEIINGQKQIFQPPSPQTWFRAFDSLDEGVSFYMGLLKNSKFKVAWSAVESGDPKAFAHLLKINGYYTAPEADYISAMTYYFNKFMSDMVTFETALANATSKPKQNELDPVMPADQATIDNALDNHGFTPFTEGT